MGRLPVRSHIGNYFVMLAYHVDSNVILVDPFQSHHDRHCLAAENRIMSRLQKNGHYVNLQILDNEFRTAYRIQIAEKWKSKSQLVTPDTHRRNAAEQMIQIFKAHFLSILSGVSRKFNNFLWDKILPQTELTLNFLHQSNIAPAISSWEHFNGPFNFNAITLAPLGSPIIIYTKPGTHRFWDFCGRKGLTIGPDLDHYRCFQVVYAITKSIIISNTIEVLHIYLNQPEVTPEDRIVHALNFLSCSVTYSFTTLHHEKMSAISKLRDLFTDWKTTTTALAPPSDAPTTLQPTNM